MMPPEIGCAISANGNPIIYGIDNANGIVLGIEIDGAHWKAALAGFARLEGIGIIPANQMPRDMGRNHG
jgi:hypothetical protein